ncbi:MAG: universal stress protein [Chloroflexota bacterium]|nr:universal stress protein [Chloroflexota bacterium]
MLSRFEKTQKENGESCEIAGDELTIRRILVALDASHHSLEALEAAADLAAGLAAELEGLFVEDINLLRAAGLPAAREVRYPFDDDVRLDMARMERQLRAQAEQARRALAAACERRGIKWSFRVTRGEITPEVLAAALEADLLILGRASRPLVRRARLGSTALAAAAQAPSSVLLLQRGAGIGPPVLVTYDGSPVARKALALAAHLARKEGGYLAVMNLAATAEEEQRLQAATAGWLREQGLLIRYRRLADTRVNTLIQAVRAEGSGILVLGSALPPEKLQTLLGGMNCPVLLVR